MDFAVQNNLRMHGNSWVPQHFPGWGAPLLFDENYNRKPAYFSVNNLLAGR